MSSHELERNQPYLCFECTFLAAESERRSLLTLPHLPAFESKPGSRGGYGEAWAAGASRSAATSLVAVPEPERVTPRCQGRGAAWWQAGGAEDTKQVPTPEVSKTPRVRAGQPHGQIHCSPPIRTETPVPFIPVLTEKFSNSGLDQLKRWARFAPLGLCLHSSWLSPAEQDPTPSLCPGASCGLS